MDLLRALRKHRLLAVVRGDDDGAARRAVEVLLGSGVELVEVSLTTPRATEVIRQVTQDAGVAGRVGAGTVVTADDADRAADAGAAFLVTPGFGPGVPRGAELGLPVLAGGFTATEAITAMANGATAVKLFPAATGGPGYLRALRDPLPHVPFVPVGGVDVGEVAPYLQAGAVAVGVGSPLLRDAARGGDLDELRERALRFLAAVGAAP